MRPIKGRAPGEPGLLLRLALALLLVAMGAGLVMALMETPRDAGLGPLVANSLADSGTGSEVTAVLLNFRGYDTLLEMAVLATALFGVWTLGQAPRIRETSLSPVLLGMNSVLIPIGALVCAYLLWAGGSRAGGAFQAGAVLAAAGVLFILAGRRPAVSIPAVPMRWGVVLGPAMFVVVALAVMPGGRHFLEYPPSLAKALILLVEATATVSIAVILAGLFLGGRPEDEP